MIIYYVNCLNLLQMNLVDYLEKVHLGKLWTAETWNGKMILKSIYLT